MDRLTERIDKIPPEGFWNSSTWERFQEVGRRLRGKGISEDEVIEILTELYFAVASEYGE